MDDELGLFGGKTQPDANDAWNCYEKGLLFYEQINLPETVKSNRNFFIGKQWEGVQANGLPTPVFNILKRTCGFTVATISSDDLKLNATTLENSAGKEELQTLVNAVNDECAALMEHNEVPALARELARAAAVDGSGCLYSWWDPDVPVGNGVMGAVKTELVAVENVIFGDPNDRDVQDQPYIQIASRVTVREAKKRAKASGSGDWRQITADSDDAQTMDSVKQSNDDKVTLLLTLWRDDESGEIWAMESTQTIVVRKPWSLGIRRYPICWLCWDIVQDCYVGEAMITGLIPNQIFINKAWAMSMLSIMRSAWPKVVYDKTKVRYWDNRVGGAIGVPGNVEGVAKILDPAAIDPQVSMLIKLAVEQTEQSLGATSVAMGDARPDNTSAIIALQRAAATPSEITKQNLYRAIEDLFRIYIEFMGSYYGTRLVDLPLPQEMGSDMQLMGVDVPATMPQPFDFSVLQDYPMMLKLDVGASSYYSEIAAMQTLDNLLMNKQIQLEDYLERIPDSYMPAKRALIEKVRKQASQQMAMMGMMAQPAPDGGQGGGPAPLQLDATRLPEVPTGGGYGQLQRAVNAGQDF